MRHLVLTLGLLVLAPSVAAANADRVARDFVRALKSGDVARAKSLIDTRYKSLPRDGVDALFGIESGYEPNLGFLVGQPFEAGRPLIVGNVRSEWYVLDGTHGQHVVIPLRF